ncbi:MAG: hypothetical protein H7A50_13880 [Akkermansiaceae bacterium]|nr:hypothetical protein [Akkermansiaceae bacterium]
MKPLPAIAVLLFGFAGTMVLLRTGADGDHPTSPTRTMSHERGAEPRRTEIARHLFDPALDRSERASLIHNLSDEDLRRLTMNLVRSVAAHGGESETRDDIRLLTLLVMESGRRDIDGLLVAIEAVPAQPPFGNEDLKARITYAALAGMAEKNPAGAWIQLTKLNADQFLREEDSATEAIFRSWVREDPNAAWSVRRRSASTSSAGGLVFRKQHRGVHRDGAFLDQAVGHRPGVRPVSRMSSNMLGRGVIHLREMAVEEIHRHQGFPFHRGNSRH